MLRMGSEDRRVVQTLGFDIAWSRGENDRVL